MAKSRNDAYAGNADMPNGVRVLICYLDRPAVVAAFGDLPRGHPNRKPIGWYWREASKDAGPHSLHGPHTSSRRAMQDALKRNGG